MFGLSIASKAEFLASIEQLTGKAVGVPCNEMAKAFKAVPENEFTAQEWHSIVNFSVDQISHWQGEWLFSLARQPNSTARKETDEWKQFCDVFTAALTEKVPGIEEQLRSKRGLLVAQRLLERKLALDQNNRVSALMSPVMGRLAIFLNRLGCKGIAQSLYKRALFPRGTVGRSQDS